MLFSDALKHKEAPIVDNSMILSETEVKEREKLSNYVSIPKEVSLDQNKIKSYFNILNSFVYMFVLEKFKCN